MMTEAEWLSCGDPALMLQFLQGKASERKLRLFAAGCVLRAWDVLEHEDPHVTETCRLAVEQAERCAEGLVSREAMERARSVVQGHAQGAEMWDDRWAVEAALVVTEPTADVAARRTADFLGQVEDFANNQADIVWLPGLAVVSSREELARWIEREQAKDPSQSLLPAWEQILWQWESIRNSNPWSQDARRVGKSNQAAVLRDIVGNPFHSLPVIDPGWLAWNDGYVRELAQTLYDAGIFDCLPGLADALEEAGCMDAYLLEHCRSEGPHVRGCWVVDVILGKV